MTEAELIGYLLLALIWCVPAYTAYLFVVKPWGPMKTRRKLHGFCGHEWVRTEDGAMAIDDEEWCFYFYKTESKEDMGILEAIIHRFP